jgi:hypothetical protein
MPLTQQSINYLGSTFQMKPINGWGWLQFDGSKYQALKFSDLPGLFEVKWLEAFSLDKDLYGGVAKVTEESHPFADLFMTFFSFTDGYSDLYLKTNSFQTKLTKNLPQIIPRKGVPAEKWLVNEQDVSLLGYIKIIRSSG